LEYTYWECSRPKLSTAALFQKHNNNSLRQTRQTVYFWAILACAYMRMLRRYQNFLSSKVFAVHMDGLQSVCHSLKHDGIFVCIQIDLADVEDENLEVGLALESCTFRQNRCSLWSCIVYRAIGKCQKADSVKNIFWSVSH